MGMKWHRGRIKRKKRKEGAGRKGNIRGERRGREEQGGRVHKEKGKESGREDS
jgi:hypothetical protein